MYCLPLSRSAVSFGFQEHPPKAANAASSSTRSGCLGAGPNRSLFVVSIPVFPIRPAAGRTPGQRGIHTTRLLCLFMPPLREAMCIFPATFGVHKFQPQRLGSIEFGRSLVAPFAQKMQKI